MFVLFLGLTVYFASNKERKEEIKKQWLVNILLRFSVLIIFFFVSSIEENRSLCLTFSEFFISHKLKNLGQTAPAKTVLFSSHSSVYRISFVSLILLGIISHEKQFQLKAVVRYHRFFCCCCGYLIHHISLSPV